MIRWNDTAADQFCTCLVFTDIQGHELFALKNKHFTIHKSFHAEGPDGKDVFVVKGQFSSTSHLDTSADPCLKHA